MSELAVNRMHSVDVSVVMPVRNGAQTLPRALDALLRQETSCRWELFVVDDASGDDSLAVAREILAGMPDAHVIANTRTPGAAGARNTGILQTAGTVVAFCDADDRIDESWVQAAFDHAAGGGAFSGLCRELHDPFVPGTPAINATGVFYNAYGAAFRTCNAAVHADLLRAVGGFDESLGRYGHEDSELCVRLTKAGHPIQPALDMVVYFYETQRRRTQLLKVWQLANAEYVYWARHPDRFASMMDLALHKRQVAGFPAYYLSLLWRHQPVRPASMGRDVVTRLGRFRAARRWNQNGGPPPPVLLPHELP